MYNDNNILKYHWLFLLFTKENNIPTFKQISFSFKINIAKNNHLKF